MPAQTVAQNEKVGYSRLLWVGPLVALAAAAANLVVLFASQAAGLVPGNIEILQPAVVAGSTAVQVLAGALVFALIGRFARRPVATFRVVALIALGLSMLNPLFVWSGGMPGVTIDFGAVAAMWAMHLVAGAIAIYGLTTYGRARHIRGAP